MIPKYLMIQKSTVIPPSSMVLLFSSLSRLCHDYVSVIIAVIVITLSKTYNRSGEADWGRGQIRDWGRTVPLCPSNFQVSLHNVKYPKFTIGEEPYPYVRATFMWASTNLLILQTHPWHRLLWTYPFWSHWVFKDILTEFAERPSTTCTTSSSPAWWCPR